MVSRHGIPWHWRWIILPLREHVWYPIKRWWYS